MINKSEIIEDNTVECYCRRCHRRLTNPKYVEIGIGPLCLKKSKRKMRPLFTVENNDTEKQKPKKPIFWNNQKWICPNCHRAEYIKDEILWRYCGFCGQEIDRPWEAGDTK